MTVGGKFDMVSSDLDLQGGWASCHIWGPDSASPLTVAWKWDWLALWAWGALLVQPPSPRAGGGLNVGGGGGEWRWRTPTNSNMKAPLKNADLVRGPSFHLRNRSK